MNRLALTTAAVSLGMLTTAAFAAPVVDQEAPGFTGATSAGGAVSLDQFEGQTVVLEWTNHDCPFVKRHYEAGTMQATQAAAKDMGAVWISVISSAPGKQGHVSPDVANALTSSRAAAPDYVVIDESGDVGRAFAAKTTPHMFVIDGDGVLRYDGAIDDKPTANAEKADGAVNYVMAALTDLSGGGDVAEKRTKPYGCSVKYGS
ncbi:MAG: redoxin family protein [Pseudomonadota bacterium]